MPNGLLASHLEVKLSLDAQAKSYLTLNLCNVQRATKLTSWPITYVLGGLVIKSPNRRKRGCGRAKEKILLGNYLTGEQLPINVHQKGLGNYLG